MLKTFYYRIKFVKSIKCFCSNIKKFYSKENKVKKEFRVNFSNDHYSLILSTILPTF